MCAHQFYYRHVISQRRFNTLSTKRTIYRSYDFVWLCISLHYIFVVSLTANHPSPLSLSFRLVAVMYKLAVISAVLASALAQDVSTLKSTQKSSQQKINKLASKLDAVSAINSEVAGNSATYIQNMVDVDAVMLDAANARGALAGLDAKSDILVAANEAEIKRQLSGAQQAMDDQLENALVEITKALSEQQEFVNTDLIGRLSTAEDANDDLRETTDVLLARLEAHKECNADGHHYSMSEGKCQQLEMPGALSKVAHRWFGNSDGRDSGYVNERYVEFTKTQDDTYIRVFYHDNFRVHGHGSWARWNIMICDENGNGCAQCKNPGQLQYWRYSTHQGNWWFNDHWSGSVAGLCKQSDNREIKKGKYQLRVMIDNNRYDIFTGHNQGNSFMVDEVFRY